MTEYFWGIGWFACALAAASVLLGRNLTRSMFACHAFIACLCAALLLGGAGFLAIVIGCLALVSALCIQVYGWMLVEIDRDRLAPTDSPTWTARALAFALLGGGLVILARAITPALRAAPGVETPRLAALGTNLFGLLDGAVLLLGFVVAAALLGAMMLLRDRGTGR